MREIMGERGDFLFAQGIGDLRHRRHAATGSHARLVVRAAAVTIEAHLRKNEKPPTWRACVKRWLFEKIWSGRRGSNPRPRPWQGQGNLLAPHYPGLPALTTY